MSLLNKVKNFFYEEEIEDEYDKEETYVEPKEKKKVKETNEINSKEISERELFKAERTFNFPMDIGDESDFETVKPKEEKIIKKIEEPVYTHRQTVTRDSAYTGIRSYAKTKEEEKNIKKFKPTPVISPIYGILDKNYKKEDIMMDSVDDYNNKKVDYDTVRKKAYGNIYNTDQELKKDIFYNLDEKEDKEEDDEVKIIYNDVTFDEEDEDVTIGEKIEKYENELDNDDLEDNDILSKTGEQDLFNLIDNMYNSDDEEDEEEE